MPPKVAIIGIGSTAFRPTSPELSYREMIYEAAVAAYADAGVAASEIQSFVSCTEDLVEGTSIADEYCPDQLGAATKPVHTISGDGIFGLASAFMLIRANLFDIMAVEAHSKASNIDDINAILAYAMDPVFQRELGLPPLAIPAMEMRRFLSESNLKALDCAKIASKNYQNALKNPLAAYGSSASAEEILASRELFSPLHEKEIARHADGAIVVVLASEKRANKRSVWLKGIGWASDTYALESREWGKAKYAADAAKQAYAVAGLSEKSVDLAEVDDTYAYKEAQHLTALGLSGRGKDLKINVSGGVIGCGNLGEANGLARVLECVLQLRGEGGGRQVDGVKNALAMSWRGVPTATGAVALIGRDS